MDWRQELSKRNSCEWIYIHVYGVILHTQIAGCLGLMSVASLSIFRHRLYEIFRVIHFSCSTSICILLWLHVPKTNKTGRIQIIVVACIWLATYIHRNGLLIYRNFSVSKPCTSILIENVHNSLLVKVNLPRPWKVKSGQYVYLTMIRPGFFTILQRHPFMVADSGSESHDFQLRIQPRAGFTNRLLARTLVGATQLRAFVEGPYGHGFDLQDFGTVVLFASGIGIVGHLAYIQELVHDYRQSKTKTRDLLLVWQVDNKYQLDLVWEFMNNILRRDDLPAAAMRQDTRALFGSGKTDRYLGSSSTNERPGVRPAPHGENASVVT
jgi:predicted ferric reductase